MTISKKWLQNDAKKFQKVQNNTKQNNNIYIFYVLEPVCFYIYNQDFYASYNK